MGRYKIDSLDITLTVTAKQTANSLNKITKALHDIKSEASGVKALEVYRKELVKFSRVDLTPIAGALDTIARSTKNARKHLEELYSDTTKMGTVATPDFWSQEATQPIAKILNHRIDPKNYTFIFSGEDPKYPAKNLSDGDLSTAMVLRPDSTGAYYLTIQLKDTNFIPDGVVIYNGYCKNREVWRNNSRIGTIEAKEIIKTQLFNNYYKKWYFQEDEYNLYGDWATLPPREPRAFDWQNLTNSAIVVKAGRGQYWEHFEGYKICIKILEITPGQKYNDLCVSEIILVGKERTR